MKLQKHLLLDLAFNYYLRKAAYLVEEYAKTKDKNLQTQLADIYSTIIIITKYRNNYHKLGGAARMRYIGVAIKEILEIVSEYYKVEEPSNKENNNGN